MNTLQNANIFFLISSIGFVLLWILIAILLIYIIRLFKSVSRISRMIEMGVANIGDDARELIDDLRDSAIFGMMFGRRKKKVVKTKE